MPTPQSTDLNVLGPVVTRNNGSVEHMGQGMMVSLIRRKHASSMTQHSECGCFSSSIWNLARSVYSQIPLRPVLEVISCSPGWLQTCYGVKDEFECWMLLPPSRCVPLGCSCLPPGVYHWDAPASRCILPGYSCLPPGVYQEDAPASR